MMEFVRDDDHWLSIYIWFTPTIMYISTCGLYAITITEHEYDTPTRIDAYKILQDVEARRGYRQITLDGRIDDFKGGFGIVENFDDIEQAKEACVMSEHRTFLETL